MLTQQRIPISYLTGYFCGPCDYVLALDKLHEMSLLRLLQSSICSVSQGVSHHVLTSRGGMGLTVSALIQLVLESDALVGSRSCAHRSPDLLTFATSLRSPSGLV